MDKKITPHPSIIQALQSESTTATPFSSIQLFIKQYILAKDNQKKLMSILSYLGEKEIAHLDTRVEKIQNGNEIFNPDFYSKILEIESGKDDKGKEIYQKLIGLAKEIIASEMGHPVRHILKNIEATLGTTTIDPSEFENPHTDISASLSDEEKIFVQQEQQVRIIINALIMGAGHRIFDKVETDKKYPQAINKISQDLYQAYYDMVYTNLRYMRENEPNNQPGNNTGSMQLLTENLDSAKNAETKIKIKADIFPVLLHEMAKGVVEYIACTRYNDLRPEITQSILSVDSRESEHRMMLIGPQIYKQLFFLIKEAISQYNEKKGLLEQKEESDYIIPILSNVMQLPADEFLIFIESILMEDQDGNVSIGLITSILDKIHNQYDAYLASSNAPKTKLTIEDIIKQINIEFRTSDEKHREKDQNFGEKRAQFTLKALPKVQELLQSEGYIIGDKKLARKLYEHFVEYTGKYNTGENINESWLTLLHDTIEKIKPSKIEQAAYGIVHEQQKKFAKWAKNHEGVLVNIQPKLPLASLEEAKGKVHDEVLEKIDNQIHELIQNGSISEWFQDHDTMSTINGQLSERFITLDDIAPECLMQRENNWGLYELTNLEQLKRESQSMGNHCAPNFINSINNGTLKIFSLRLGTKSRWTIGYKPGEQTINQIKGFTNGEKNAILKDNDPDHDQVIQALKYISKNMMVKQINDIHGVSGLTFTNKGLFSSDEFFELLKGETEGLYETMILSPIQKLIITDVTIEILERINLRNIGMLELQICGLTVQYNIKDKKITITGKSTPAKENSLKIGTIIEKLSNLKKDPFFAKYDDYPFFGENGLGDKRASVTKEGKYGVIQKIENGFKEIISCIYDNTPQFGVKGLLFDEAIVDRDTKYGIIKENNGVRPEALPCEYDKIPLFGVKGLAENEAMTKKNGGYGITRRNIGGPWLEILPHIYNSMPEFGTKGLLENEAIIRIGGNLPFGNPLLYGIMKRDGDSFTELLPCRYDSIYEFGIQGLPTDEARVTKNGKYGIIKKGVPKYEELIPCEYDKIPQFGTEGLAKDEAITQKNGKYGITKKDTDRIWTDSVPHQYSDISEVGGRGFLKNEFIVTVVSQGKDTEKKRYGIMKKNIDGIRTVSSMYDKITEFGVEGLETDEIGILNNGKYGIIKRDNTGYIELVHCKYDSIPQFGTEGLAKDEARVKEKGKYGIIKKNLKESTEIVPCEYDSIPIFGTDILQKTEIFLADEEQLQVIRKIPKFGVMGQLYNQAKVKINGKEYLWRKNPDGTWDQSAYHTYENIQYGICGLQKNQARVKENGEYGKYGIIEKKDDNTRNEILPYKYDNIPVQLIGGVYLVKSRERIIFIHINNENKWEELGLPKYDILERGRMPNEFFVTEYGKEGIIEIYENGTRKKILDCLYDQILETREDTMLVNNNGKTLALKKDTEGAWKKFFVHTYNEILQFGTDGLSPNEAVVRENNEVIIIRKDGDNTEEVIESDYIIKDFAKFGLQEHEARAKKKGDGMGIIHRDFDGNITELLPCIYDAIGEFGTEGLAKDEAMVMKDKKCGIIRRTKDGFTEVLPCKYYSIGEGSSKDENQIQDEIRVQDKDFKNILFKKTEKGYMETKLSASAIKNLKFGKYGLPANMSFISIEKKEDENDYEWTYAYGLVIKDPNGDLTILTGKEKKFKIKKKKEIFLKNHNKVASYEYRVLNDNDFEKIVHINDDGSIKDISNYYETIYDFGEHSCRKNEAFIGCYDNYGVIKRNTTGVFDEIVECDYSLSDELIYYGFEYPIIFYYKLIDNKRVAIAMNQGEKKLLLENNKGILDEIENPETFLSGQPKLLDFYTKAFRLEI